MTDKAHPSDSLLPCPICGKPGQRNGRGKAGGVVCAQRTHRLQAYGSSQVEAEEVWNTRAALAAPGGEGEPELALEDARLHGIGFIVDGQRVSPDRVTVCHGGAPEKEAAPADGTGAVGLVDMIRSRIGQEFEGECHLTEEEANEIIGELTAPPEPVAWRPDRESVARIIDPDAWAFADRHAGKPVLQTAVTFETRRSLTKADTILALALTAPSSKEGA